MSELVRRGVRATVAALLLLACNGCVDVLSWSPDGKKLAFIDSDETLWLWNSQTHETKKIADGVVSCRFVPSGHLLFAERIAAESNTPFGPLDPFDESDYWLQVLSPGDSISISTVSNLSNFAGASGDGRYWYYIREDETDDEQAVVWEYEHATQEKRHLFKTTGDFAQCSGDTTGSRVLYMAERAPDMGFLALFDKASGTSKDIDTGENRAFWWPTWVDEERVLAISAATQATDGGSEPETGDLVLYNLANGEKRILQSRVPTFQPLSLSPDHGRVLTIVAQADVPDDWIGSSQIACVDIKSGVSKILTKETFGAGMAEFRPTGNAIAYLTPADTGDEPAVVVLDLDTQTRTFAWFNEDQRQFALAETMLDSGRKAEALTMYESLLEQKLGREIADKAYYRVAEIAASGDAPDWDKAYAAYREIRLGNHKAQLYSLLGEKALVSAADPAGDCIRAYSTEEGRQRFEVDTDSTRDLRGIRLWWSSERLYIKVDYQSAYDIEGLGFSDTVFLFDYDSPESGLRSITPLVDWEGGAERQVIFRHWFDTGTSGRYDIQVLGEKGETISQFVASGFGKAVYPVVNVEDTRYDQKTKGGGLVLSFLRETMDFPEKTDIHVQVCTAQGGVAGRLELERPREIPGTGKPECDIADAFGEENTRERIDADLKANESNAEYRAVIRGYAVSTRAPEP